MGEGFVFLLGGGCWICAPGPGRPGWVVSDLKAANILRDVKELAQARRGVFALVVPDLGLGGTRRCRRRVRALLGGGCGMVVRLVSSLGRV